VRTTDGRRKDHFPAWRKASIPATIVTVVVSLATMLFAMTGAAQAETPWAKRLTGYLPARDGLLLKYSVLLPSAKGKFPVIMNYSGYDPGSIGGSAYRDGDTTMSAALDARLLKAGYAIFGVNMAGTGCSEGKFDLWAKRWSTDGRDAVEWAARQRWSNGRIGMANWSYAGIGQIFTALARPPHLRAIAPGMPVLDPWRDVARPGGSVNVLFPLGWTIYIQDRWQAAKQSAISEADSDCLTNLAANEAAFPGVSPLKNLTTRPYPEDLPRDQRTWLQTKRIKVPVLSFQAWQDEATGPRAGYFQNALNPEKTYLIGTNGPHSIYESRSYGRIMLRFFDRYVKGEANGFDRGPRVRIWQETGTAGMTDALAGSLPAAKPRTVLTAKRLPVKLKPVRLYLRSGGRMASRPARNAEPSDDFQYPVPGPAVNDDLGVGNDQWKNTPVNHNGTVAFTGSRLGKALTFFGPASFDLWVSSTAPDADLQATVTEVRPDGQEVYVQRGWLRLSQRDTDPRRSTIYAPFARLRRSGQPITSPQAVYARLEIQQFSHIFRKGSRIRVWLDSPSTTGEWGFKIPTDPSTLSIHHGPNRKSKLVLGLVKRGGISTALPQCDSVMREPCRQDPIPIPGD